MIDMPSSNLPTARLVIVWPEGTPPNPETEDAFNAAALDQIKAKAEELVAAGERPWMEVWYQGVPGREDSTEADFDAVEVAPDGTITTLPPYSELTGASS